TIGVKEIVFGKPDSSSVGVPKFDLPGAKCFGGEGGKMALCQMDGQAAGKRGPWKLAQFGMMVENGFGKAAAVKVTSADKKNSLVRVIRRREIWSGMRHSEGVAAILDWLRGVTFFFR